MQNFNIDPKFQELTLKQRQKIRKGGDDIGLRTTANTEHLNINNLNESIIPTAASLETLIEYYNGFKADPDKLVFGRSPRGIAITLKDQAKIMRYFFSAIILRMPEYATEIKKRKITPNYSVGELRAIAEYVQTNIDQEVLVKAVAYVNDHLSERNADGTLKRDPQSPFTESFEIKSELNPKLFDKEEQLKPEIREKILDLVDAFKAELKNSEVELNESDVLIVGSNASYNYTPKSDLDVHIISKDGGELNDIIYGAYRTIFNSKFDVSYFGIPVEIFVEVKGTPRQSNGEYSVLKDKWLKKPEPLDNIEVDNEATDKLIDEYSEKCKDLLDKLKTEDITDETEVVDLIEEIYDLRKNAIKDGEYTPGNLAFKELRNKEYLDKLKDARVDIISKKLSIEEAFKQKQQRKIEETLQYYFNTDNIEFTENYFIIKDIPEKLVEKYKQAAKKSIYVESFAQPTESKAVYNRLYPRTAPAKFYSMKCKIKKDH